MKRLLIVLFLSLVVLGLTPDLVEGQHHPQISAIG
jgi:hypothetical protein